MAFGARGLAGKYRRLVAVELAWFDITRRMPVSAVVSRILLYSFFSAFHVTQVSIFSVLKKWQILSKLSQYHRWIYRSPSVVYWTLCTCSLSNNRDSSGVIADSNEEVENEGVLFCDCVVRLRAGFVYLCDSWTTCWSALEHLRPIVASINTLIGSCENMEATYCVGNDVDVCRMFDQYLYKVLSNVNHTNTSSNVRRAASTTTSVSLPQQFAASKKPLKPRTMLQSRLPFILIAILNALSTNLLVD